MPTGPRALRSTGPRDLGPLDPLVRGTWALVHRSRALGPVHWSEGPGAYACAAISIPPQAPSGHSDPAPGPVRPFQSCPRGPRGPLAPVSIPILPQKGPRGPCGAWGHSKPPQQGPGGPRGSGEALGSPGEPWGPGALPAVMYKIMSCVRIHASKPCRSVAAHVKVNLGAWYALGSALNLPVKVLVQRALQGHPAAPMRVLKAPWGPTAQPFC